MKKVTTKITKKTPSSTSVSNSVTTSRMQNPRGGQSSGLQQPGFRQGTGQQQQKRVQTVSSKTSVSSVTVDGQRKTRTEESVTTRIQMPIAQAASNWQSGLRGSGQPPPRLSYAQQKQQKLQKQMQAEQQQAQAQAQAEALRAQSAIPKMKIPRAIPRNIAGLAQQQYAQLMMPESAAATLQRQKQRQQVPQSGGQIQTTRQQQMPQQRRQMQQPQIGAAGSRSKMQQPGVQSRLRQPRGGTAPPTRVIAQVAPPNLFARPSPRQGPRSPETMEFELLEQFSPATMREYEMMEQDEAARRTPQQISYPPREFASIADQQYQSLMSSQSPPKGPCGPTTCGAAQSPQDMRPRRMMAQPGFASGTPQQVLSAADQQYAALMDTPEPRRMLDPRQSPQVSRSPQQYSDDLITDISLPTAASGHPTDLELQVEQALMNTSRSKPGTPLRAEGTIQRLLTPQESPDTGLATVQTPMGRIPAESQLLIEGVVKRTPKEEIVTRHVVAVEGGIVDERETVQMTPGKGIRRAKTPESKELIVCSSEVKMAGGYRETTSKVFYETTEDPPTSSHSPKLPSSVTPTIISQLVLEESLDVDKTTKLHAPDLKHSSPLTYGIKKRVNTLQLNKMEVAELEQSVAWPPPRADEAQEDPQPELLATIMHTEEKGLTMGSTPDQLYSALFGSTEPVKIEEGTMDVNSVATHPLNDVVVPGSPASRDIHIVGITPELADAAVNAHSATEEVRHSDGAYAERVLGDKTDSANVKVKNVGRRDGPPVKYPVFFDVEKAAPWEVDKFDAVIKQVGAIPTSVLEVSVVGPASAGAADELRDVTTDGIEYLLNMNEVSHESYVQLRGSHPPSWFPGYYMALGGLCGGNTLTIARSPSTVLAAAYKSVQPEMFNDDSIIAV